MTIEDGAPRMGADAGLLALLCSPAGAIREVLFDRLGLPLAGPAPARLQEMADGGDEGRVDELLAQAWKLGTAFAPGLRLGGGPGLSPVTLLVVRRDNDLLAFATQSPRITFADMERLVSAVGRHCPDFCERYDQSPASASLQGPELDDFTRLNNELVNAQRDLARINLELQRQESRFRNLLRDVPVAVAVVDLKGETLFVNSSCASIFGRREDDMIGHPFPLKFDGDSIAGSGKFFSTLVLRSDETIVPIEISCVCSYWESRPSHIVAINDISERVHLEREKAEVERILHHDLKVPLTAIINLPQIMRMDSGVSPEHREYLNYIEAAGQKMLRMITQSIDLHRMERGEFQPEHLMIDLLATVRDISGELLPLAHAKGLGISLTVHGQEPQSGRRICVAGTSHHISGLIGNLLTNALEAAPQGSKVSLDLSVESGSGQGERLAVLRIHNLGAVPEAIRSRFFEKYATYGKKSGTGLGTYSARLIARAHGGDVDFDSSDGASTTLMVRLPLWSDTSA